MEDRRPYNEYVIGTRADYEWQNRFGGEEPSRLPSFSHSSFRLPEEPSPAIDHSLDGSSADAGFWNFVAVAALAGIAIWAVYDWVNSK